jgi:hypothetical protein
MFPCGEDIRIEAVVTARARGLGLCGNHPIGGDHHGFGRRGERPGDEEKSRKRAVHRHRSNPPRFDVRITQWPQP